MNVFPAAIKIGDHTVKMVREERGTFWGVYDPFGEQVNLRVTKSVAINDAEQAEAKWQAYCEQEERAIEAEIEARLAWSEID